MLNQRSRLDGFFLGRRLQVGRRLLNWICEAFQESDEIWVLIDCAAPGILPLPGVHWNLLMRRELHAWRGHESGIVHGVLGISELRSGDALGQSSKMRRVGQMHVRDGRLRRLAKLPGYPPWAEVAPVDLSMSDFPLRSESRFKLGLGQSGGQVANDDL
jgi:hypothetical protein